MLRQIQTKDGKRAQPLTPKPEGKESCTTGDVKILAQPGAGEGSRPSGKRVCKLGTEEEVSPKRSGERRGEKKAAVGPRLGRTSNLGRCGGEEKWKSFQGPFTGGNGLKDQRRACEQMDLGKPSGPDCDGHRRDAWGTRRVGRRPGEPRAHARSTP